MQVRLIRDLAKGEHRDAELARRYGVTRPSILEFKRRHKERIDQQRQHIDDAFASIEFADQTARVAELSSDVADIAALLADPKQAARVGVGLAEMLRAKQGALRAIAEERGQLPSRHQVQVGGSLDVSIGGVELKDLT